MFKLVVLCALLAAVVAEPSAIFAPLAYSTSFLAPARTTITNSASSVIHPSPLAYSGPWAYSAPFAHLIKKRSAGFISSYIAPSTYVAHAPFATTYAAPLATTYAAPLATTYAAPFAATYSAPVYTAAAHFIKKRSAGLFYPTSYVASAPLVASTYTAPLVTSTYTAAAPILSTPFVSHSPISYTHLIKKRSAPLFVAPYASAAVSHQSRLDIQSSPAVASYSYSAPLSYASPFAYSHIF